MPQTSPLITTLKACLKAERKTYADVAAALELTEASVKRLFSEENFTLERLDAVCRMLGMEISDLVGKMNAATPRLEHLSLQQEQEITEDLVLLMVMVCIFNRWSIEDITGFYTIGEAECLSKLLRLDQLNIIDLLPGNRVKLRISPNFKWLDNGPIQRFFRERVGREFFDIDFQREGECLLVLNGMLPPPAAQEFQRKLERLAKEFNELNNEYATLPIGSRKGATLVMAMRNWEYGLFQHMIRK